MDDRERRQNGMKLRREILGDAHVDRAEAGKTAFDEDFQDFLTRYAWGEVWSRPGITRHTRSLITLSMLIALNRPEELRMHFSAAWNNGVTEGELKELILHSSLYCGLPAANHAYRIAAEVMAGRVL